MVHTNNGYELTNIKAYELSALDNLTELQAIIDFVIAWNFPIVYFNSNSYLYRNKADIWWWKDGYYFYDTRAYWGYTNAWINQVQTSYILIEVNRSWDNVSSAGKYNPPIANYLSTSNPTSGTFTPTEDNHPSTKKYVDDNITPLNTWMTNLQYQFDHFYQWWKLFVLDSTADLVTWQEIIDFIYTWRWVSYVLYDNKYYTMCEETSTTLTMSNMSFDANWFYVNTLTFTFDADKVLQSITTSHKNIMTVNALPEDIDDDTLYLVTSFDV